MSLLSENTFLNYDSNGIIKIIDRRANRIVSYRHLKEEMNLIDDYEYLFFSWQENHVKYWNNDKSSLSIRTPKNTSQFVINLNNQLIEVDLRSNRITKENSLFKFNQPRQISNY